MIRFTLNGRPVAVDQAAPTTTLLDWLRASGHTGTKEGCAEGDCGACCVAVRDEGAPGGARWRAENSCLVLLPQLEGRTLVTVEGLATAEGLHPAQQAMVDTLGSQCGYCTPGFVMSLFEATYREDLGKDAASWRLDDQLAGNLCRCTGYRPIREAAERVAGTRPDDAFKAALSEEAPRPAVLSHETDGERFLSPTSLAELWPMLAEHPDATLVAGATDLGLQVTKRHGRWPVVIGLERIGALRRLEATEESVLIGAGVRLSDLEEWAHEGLPMLARQLRYFAARSIKNRATVGGNLVNASPIGDLAPVLLALGATVLMSSVEGEREIPLDDFFVAYRQTALQPGEILAAVAVPLPDHDTRLGAYKVSKRRELDISAVAAGMAVRTDAIGRVTEVRLAYGGMAATPARALLTEQALMGEPWTAENVQRAAAFLDHDFTPIDDHRSSAWYRATVARNLLLGFFDETRENPLAPLRAGHTGTLEVG